jgi:hypothetical protein
LAGRGRERGWRDGLRGGELRGGKWVEKIEEGREMGKRGDE